MTENEIKNTKEWFEDFIETYALSNQETIEFKKAVACLEELQQYRAVGTVEECEKAMDFELAKQDKMFAKVIDDYLKYIKIGTIEEFKALKEKSRAKKIRYEHYCGFRDAECLVCGKGIRNKDEYCSRCGQKLDRQ